MGRHAEAAPCVPSCRAERRALAEIFQASIEELTGEDYSEAQQEAWASTADDGSVRRSARRDA